MESIEHYVEQTNRSCPIDYSKGLTLDSVEYLKGSSLVQHLSLNLIPMSDTEFEHLQTGYKEHMIKAFSQKASFRKLLINHKIDLVQKISNTNDKSQHFEIVIRYEDL